MRRVLYVVCLLNQGPVVSLTAQQLGPGFVRWELPATSLALQEQWRTDQQDTTLAPRRDYRYEGLAFGGIVFGAAGAWLGWNVGVGCPLVPGADCEPDRLGNAAAVGLAAAALGGGLGYLVGRLSPKPPPGSLPAAESLLTPISPEKKPVGYHHWEGTAIGAGGGALLIALLYLAVGNSCSDCEGGSSHLLEAELIGAGVGGTLGFLIGLGIPKFE